MSHAVPLLDRITGFRPDLRALRPKARKPYGYRGVAAAMKQLLSLVPLGSLLALGLSACSPRNDGQPIDGSPTDASTSTAVSDRALPAPDASQSIVSPARAGEARTIGLEGLGELRLGQPVPKGGKWAERGAQTGESCRTISSPDYPGVYGIVVDGKVRRITVGQGSDVKLVEGIGVGATQRDVEKWFGGFRAEPHKYEAAPAKYLTAPNAASGDPAVRFEIGHDGAVKMIHVGMMPELALVEGCA